MEVRSIGIGPTACKLVLRAAVLGLYGGIVYCAYNTWRSTAGGAGGRYHTM